MSLLHRRVKYNFFDEPTDIGLVLATPQDNIVYIESETIPSVYKPAPGKKRQVILLEHAVIEVEVNGKFEHFQHNDLDCIACQISLERKIKNLRREVRKGSVSRVYG